MARLGWLLCATLLACVPWALAGTYECTINAAGEAVLDRAIESDYPDQTRAQVIQSLCNREVVRFRERQISQLGRSINDKIDVLTPGQQVTVLNGLNNLIIAPEITDIANQTHNVAASPVIAIVVATNPYPEKALSYRVTGLPPEMQLTFVPGTNTPEITGTLTTPGTYGVTVEAWNFVDKKGTDTFTWTINP